MNTNKTTYTLEYLQQLKGEKQAELARTKEKITDLTHAIIAPPVVNSNMELWMHYASNGMTVYRGIMTCVKLFKRFKDKFPRKKKSKSLFS